MNEGGRKASISEYKEPLRVFVSDFILDTELNSDKIFTDYFTEDRNDIREIKYKCFSNLLLSCEVEVKLVSETVNLKRKLKTFTFEQLKGELPSLKLTSFNIERLHYVFTWKKEIIFPIHYCDIPLDSSLEFKFTMRIANHIVSSVNSYKLELFSKEKLFRSGLFTLTFGDTDWMQNELFKSRRRIYEKSANFTIYNQIMDHFHPSDVIKIHDSLFQPLKPLQLSESSMYSHVSIINPDSDKNALIYYEENNIGYNIGVKTEMTRCEMLFYQMSSTLANSDSKITNNSTLMKFFNNIKSLSPLVELSHNDKVLLIEHRKFCMKDPKLLIPLFRSIDFSVESKELDEIWTIKDNLELDIEIVLEFFTSRYNIQKIRTFAIEYMWKFPKEEIYLYLMQIVQATKAEFSEKLGDLLVHYSKDDVLFASKLYWLLHVEYDHFEWLIEKFKDKVSKEIRNEIKLQKKLIKKIGNAFKEHSNKKTTQETRKQFKSLLSEPRFSKFEPTRLPLDPTIIVVGIDSNDIRVFQSKLRPVMITFNTNQGDKYRVVFKYGDDMRQDQLIIELFEVMDNIFQNASMNLHITTYKVLAFSKEFGCCQFITDSTAIMNLITEKRTIRQYLRENNGDLDKQIEIFTKSLAAYSVMTYVLSIGDRHDNNILVVKDGRLLHIDYGFILGDVTKPFTPRIKLSREMLDTIGTDGMKDLISWASPAYLSIRKKARLILVLIELMFYSPLECFKSDDSITRLHLVENSLMLNCPDIDAIKNLNDVFISSSNSIMQSIWDKVHGIAVSANGPSAETD